QNFDDVWSIHSTDSLLIVQTFSRVFLIPVISEPETDSILTGEVRILRTASVFFPACFFDHRFYVTEKNTGLLMLEGDRLVPVPGGELFAKDIVYMMLPYGDPGNGKALIGTLKQGLFLFDGEEFDRFRTDLDEYLVQHRLYLGGTVLPDGTFALGTQLGGVAVIDSTGHGRVVINRGSGLRNETVWFSYLDREGGLWLALDDGLARVTTPFDVSLFDESTGLEGRASSVSINSNRLFVATGSGFFSLVPSELPGLPARFRKLPGINVQSWSIATAGGDLIAATNDGVFSLSGKEPRPIGGSLPYSFKLLPSKSDPDLLYVSRHNGLALIRRTGGIWQDALTLPEITDPIPQLIEGRPGVLWAGSFNRRLLRIRVDGRSIDVREIPELTGFGITGLLYREEQDEIICATDRGLLRIDGATETVLSPRAGDFLADSLLNIRAIAPGTGDEIWVLAVREGKMILGVLDHETGQWHPAANSFLLRKMLEAPASSMSFDIAVEDHRAVWIAGGDAVVRYSLPDHTPADDLFVTWIRSVMHSDTLVSYARSREHEFPAGSSLRVGYALSSYQAPDETEYQYQLEGFEEGWSGWSRQTTKEYTNLSAGRYLFRVRGLRSDGVVGESATFGFTVLPPWYLTPWAMVAGALVMVLAIWVAISVRVRVLTARTKKLEEMVAERTTQVVAQKTQLEEQARRLMELDELKSRFFANISHEFRTPLTLILGQIESVLRTVTDSSLRTKLETAARNGKRLHRLINQLLEIAKLESGRTRLMTSRTDLVPMCRQRFFSFESLAEQKQIGMRFDHSQEQIEAVVDRDKLIEVVDNLLSNAIKFTPRHGSIRLSLAADGEGHATITVADTGVGIPDHEIPLVFDRFHQADTSHTREHEGSGLGLSIARELVLLHKGEINVTSIEGKGTEFRVLLPLRLPETIGGPADETTEDQWPEEPRLMSVRSGIPADAHRRDDLPERKALVLIVEDNEDMQEYIRENLPTDCTGVVAGDGEDGLERAFLECPDLIITDVMMPRKDGMAMSRQLRNDERTSHIPIVMLTAKVTEEGRLEGLETGVDDYLIKPFSPRELQVRIGNLLKMRRILRERFSRATALDPAAVTEKSLDREFLEKILDRIKTHIEDPTFGVQRLADQIGMSVSQVNRKLNALIGQSAGRLIRSSRLEFAAGLLARRAGSVAEIADRVGFADQASFSRSFRDRFQCSPSEYTSRSGTAKGAVTRGENPEPL
ncbi:MAG: ATP-binding protein, partial [Ignavibacteria bacterium]|nr:ATP-binding protein [Ignavibacteria bacterium]